MPLRMEVGLGPGDIVLDGDPVPSPKKAYSSPQFSAHALWSNSFINQDDTWYRGRPRPRRHRTRWGSSSPPQTKGIAPHFRPMYCGQTAGWIKMSVGTEVGLGPGDIVLDSKPALPPRKGGGGTR